MAHFPVVWCFPPPLCVKVNADGLAWGNPGLAGVGMVIRDDRGVALAGAYEVVGSRSNIKTEILIVYQGVTMVCGLNISTLLWILIPFY